MKNIALFGISLLAFGLIGCTATPAPDPKVASAIAPTFTPTPAATPTATPRVITLAPFMDPPPGRDGLWRFDSGSKEWWPAEEVTENVWAFDPAEGDWVLQIPPTPTPAPVIPTPIPTEEAPPTVTKPDVAYASSRLGPSVALLAWQRDENEAITTGATGIVFDVEGDTAYVATAYHAVEGAILGIALVNDQIAFPSVLGYHKEYDLAVLEVTCGGCPSAKLIESEGTIEYADEVIVMGFSDESDRDRDGLPDLRIMEGNVIRTYRDADVGVDVIETNVGIGPGGSGGPVIAIPDEEIIGIVIRGKVLHDGIESIAIDASTIGGLLGDLKAGAVIRKDFDALYDRQLDYLVDIPEGWKRTDKPDVEELGIESLSGGTTIRITPIKEVVSVPANYLYDRLKGLKIHYGAGKASPLIFDEVTVVLQDNIRGGRATLELPDGKIGVFSVLTKGLRSVRIWAEVENESDLAAVNKILDGLRF